MLGSTTECWQHCWHGFEPLMFYSIQKQKRKNNMDQLDKRLCPLKEYHSLNMYLCEQKAFHFFFFNYKKLK
jgi:hypothetical protein